MIFLSILKIIGIILLIILLLVILLLLAVLFVPIRYRADFKYYDVLSGKGNATWLFHIISVKVSYSNEESFFYRIKLFGIQLFPKKHKNKKDKIGKQNKTGKQEAEISEEKESTTNSDNKVELEKVNSNTDTCSSNEQRDFEDKKTSKLKSIKEKITNIWKKIKKIYKKWHKILTDEHNKNAYQLLKGEFFKLLKKIMPQKMKLKAKYGLGEPDRTALALGVVSLFPIGYQNNWKIYPDFEADEMYFQGEGFAKGKIRLYHVIFPGIKIFFNREVKRLIKMVTK